MNHHLETSQNQEEMFTLFKTFFLNAINQKERSIKTLLACLSYISIGLQASVIGVALLDLRVLAGCSLDQITLSVTSRALSYALGSVMSGLIASRINVQLSLAMSLIVGAAAHFATPFSRSLIVVATFTGIGGLSCGFVDCFANMFILKLWAKKCPPFLQALHFSYGIGSLAVSLIVEPFLKEDIYANDDVITNYTQILMVNVSKKIDLVPQDIELFIPYTIIGTFISLTSVLLLISYLICPQTPTHPSANDDVIIKDGEKDGEKIEIKKIVNEKVKILVMICAIVLVFTYIGLEKTIGTFITTFSHNGPLRLPKREGATITGIFWVAFTTFRLFAVILSGIFGSSIPILIFNFSITIIACVLLTLIQTNETIFWVSITLIGVGLSSTFGSIYGFLEHQLHLNGTIIAALSVGSCFGASIMPAVIGMAMAANNQVFAWYSLTSSVVVALIAVLIYFMCKTILFREEKRMI